MSPRDGGVATRSLTDPGVAKVITKMLRDQGVPAWDLEDARQDVYAKALKAIRRGRAPAETEEMKNFCVKIAEEHAIDLLRKADVRALVVVDDCRPEELAPLRSSRVQRDPVDAGRQLEVLAQLFREKAMPPDGVDILEGVACRCTHAEIALDLGIEPNLVKSRLHQMRKVYRRRLVTLLRNVLQGALKKSDMDPNKVANQIATRTVPLVRETRWPTGASGAPASNVISLTGKSRESSAIPGDLAAANRRRSVAV
jgi:RNA polymerase sigma factor (sigma-70 family)